MSDLEPGWLKRQTESDSLNECPTCGGHYEAAKVADQPVGKTLIADEKENVWRDDNGDIWEPIRARILVRESSIYAALERLVHLKGYKDKNGKDAYYESEQPHAWKQAQIALNQIEGGKP